MFTDDIIVAALAEGASANARKSEQLVGWILHMKVDVRQSDLQFG